VRNSFDPPKKFSFKNRKKDVAKSGVVTPKISSEKASSPLDQTSPSQHHDTQQQEASTSALSHKSHTRITLPPTPHTTSSPTVSHLSHCIVDLSAPTRANAPFAALYLRSITSSLIITGQVAGAIHITNVSNSVIVTACRQFRMHGSKHVDIYLHSASRPIFEDCEGLRFAPLPGVYVSSLLSQAVFLLC
jgi:hypothetical protein